MTPIVKSIPAALFLLLVWTHPALAQVGRGGGPGGGGWCPNFFGYGSGAGWAGGIFSLLLWVLIILGVVFLAKRIFAPASQRQKPGGASGPDPLGILKERYAKGEISRQEYQEMKADLED